MKKYLITLLVTPLTIFTAENKENGVVTLKINVQEPAAQLKKFITTIKDEINKQQEFEKQYNHPRIDRDTIMTLLSAASPAIDELTKEHDAAVIIEKWENWIKQFDALMDETPLLVKASYVQQGKAHDFFTLLFTSFFPNTEEALKTKKEIIQEIVTQPQLIPKKSSSKPARTTPCTIL